MFSGVELSDVGIGSGEWVVIYLVLVEDVELVGVVVVFVEEDDGFGC